jgi:hypothetical protein
MKMCTLVMFSLIMLHVLTLRHDVEYIPSSKLVTPGLDFKYQHQRSPLLPSRSSEVQLQGQARICVYVDSIVWGAHHSNPAIHQTGPVSATSNLIAQSGNPTLP